MPAVKSIRELWEAHIAADRAWMAEIEKAFTKEWPGDVRYTAKAKGEPCTDLRLAYLNFLETRKDFDNAGGCEALHGKVTS